MRVDRLHKSFQMVIAFKISPFGSLSEPRIKKSLKKMEKGVERDIIKCCSAAVLQSNKEKILNPKH